MQDQMAEFILRGKHSINSLQKSMFGNIICLTSLNFSAIYHFDTDFFKCD